MLLCAECHSTIDKRWTVHPVTWLRRQKAVHEGGVKSALKSVGSDSKLTQVIRLSAPIGGSRVGIPREQCILAIRPNHCTADDWVISLNELEHLDENITVLTATEKITTELARLQSTMHDQNTSHHYSVFALAPISLLIHLGAQLDRTVPCDVYNRQHDRDDWTWQKGAPQHEFEWSELQRAANASEVALMVHTSGTNRRKDLPSHIDSSFAVYEIRPIGVAASKNIVRNLETVAAFRRCYEDVRRHIRDQHPKATTIHLFPAISPAIAVTIGRELIRKTDPSIQVYDWNKKAGGFQFALEVNQ